MSYEIVLSPQAVEDLRGLDARHRANLRRAMERHLRHQPEKTSRSRIKRLRGTRKPQYRLRVDDHRVFYDVVRGTVEVLAIVHKPDAASWLARHGEVE